MGLAWKCDWCGKYYIGHSYNEYTNATDSVYIKQENSRGIIDSGVGYIICDECKSALKELIKNRKRTD